MPRNGTAIAIKYQRHSETRTVGDRGPSQQAEDLGQKPAGTRTMQRIVGTLADRIQSVLVRAKRLAKRSRQNVGPNIYASQPEMRNLFYSHSTAECTRSRRTTGFQDKNHS
eukprot:2306006-Ditylum_brightwellii.AAC.1